MLDKSAAENSPQGENFLLLFGLMVEENYSDQMLPRNYQASFFLFFLSENMYFICFQKNSLTFWGEKKHVYKRIPFSNLPFIYEALDSRQL